MFKIYHLHILLLEKLGGNTDKKTQFSVIVHKQPVKICFDSAVYANEQMHIK